MKSKRFYLPMLVALLLFSGSARARPLNTPPADMHAASGFTNASFQGNYALTGFVGTNVAAIVGVGESERNLVKVTDGAPAAITDDLSAQSTTVITAERHGPPASAAATVPADPRCSPPGGPL